MFDFINRFFKREEPTASSGRSARDRLQLVLIQDRASVAPELMDSLRTDLIQLISRYMDIDTGSMSVELERREGAVALAASIPIINIHRTQPPLQSALTDAQTLDTRRARYLKRRREAIRRRRLQTGDDDQDG